MENYLGVDQHFTVFHELMARKVRHILLVSSPYDAFIMEEDGSIASRIINEFHGLNLSNPPRLQWAATAAQGLELLRRKRYDLVITMPQVNDMDGQELAREVKAIYADVPVVLLAHSVAFAGSGSKPIDCGKDIDHFFIWSSDPALFLAIIKNVEDHLNVAVDTTKAMVRVLILVEDSPLYASYFLPLIYRMVVRQTQKVLDESLNQEHRLLKMRARPKILLATNFEEAEALYRRYQEYVFAIISDVRFPRQCSLDPQAGLRLLAGVRAEKADLPMLLLSAEAQNRQRAAEIKVGFADKNSARLSDNIEQFFLEHLGFGDFVFRLPDGRVADRAGTFRALEHCLATVAEESLLYHARHNHFSNWIMARSEVELALEIGKARVADFTSVAAIRAFLIEHIHALRRRRQQGVVVQFSEAEFDPEVMDFVKMGAGSLGGKGRGLAFLTNILPFCRELADLKLKVKLPKTTVIGADEFTEFVRENDLEFPDGHADDQEVARIFLDCHVPTTLSRALRFFLGKVTGPLTIRSSSVLEDGHGRPYAGLYKTYMLANNHADFRVRFKMLQDAVKLVWASTWYADPQAFSRSVRSAHEKDAMAVIIQELVGRQYGHFYYPALSGVALSHNFYPVSYMKAEDGVAHIALGLGKTVVEGEKSLRFSPRYPQIMPQFSTVDDILDNCQRFFYCLDLRKNHGDLSSDDAKCLVRREVDGAEDEQSVQMLASTYDAAEHRIRDGIQPGMKVLTFAQILKHQLIALPESLAAVLRLSRAGLGCAAEVEFAVDLAPDPTASTLYILQVRPMLKSGEQARVEFTEAERQQAFCHSTECLGHGVFTGIADLIYVKPEHFDPAVTREIAREIHGLNAKLEGLGRPYLLAGPGRWGSADPWLGIPVQWQDIAGVRALVELRPPGFTADPSQGSHFFQNITSLGIPYVTVSEGSGYFDFDRISEQEFITETTYLRHVRVSSHILIKVNGREPECLMLVADHTETKHDLPLAD
ncbi:MAG: phosphoenolpyruvate synthase/pyruvate phosphate dikinase [Desulfobulbaceae bacterium]|nr:MAG: phosphoenolpyruvate synthase/pyruvate phosphate dikinase [Desulfobulbaceae bacterium]